MIVLSTSVSPEKELILKEKFLHTKSDKLMKIWQTILDHISENKSTYLLTVFENKGSSPGKYGFKMVICDDGSMTGSIGGGAMEYELVEKCKSLLSINQRSNFVLKQSHNEGNNDTSGMICSGEQSIGFISIDKDDQETIIEIIKHLVAKKTVRIHMDPNGLKLVENSSPHTHDYVFTDENSWWYEETLGVRNKLYIIGAGHVGFAVSKLFSQLDFDVILFDNRPKLSMLEENPYASIKKVIDYNEIESYVVEGKNSYVIIATNKHTGDKLILSKLIRKNLAYLGLLGSKAKVSKFKEQLPDEDFSKLHAPVGIKINSITPDEIAVSIAAEVIMVKNKS